MLLYRHARDNCWEEKHKRVEREGEKKGMSEIGGEKERNGREGKKVWERAEGTFRLIQGQLACIH